MGSMGGMMVGGKKYKSIEASAPGADNDLVSKEQRAGAPAPGADDREDGARA